MDEKTRKALEGSIAKWQAIVDGTGKDNGTDNCPLCRMFHSDFNYCEGAEECTGCPVAEEVQDSNCVGTPYYAWTKANSFADDKPWSAVTDEQKQAAQKELDFLISLRPKD
jgi:hypothetical protein